MDPVDYLVLGSGLSALSFSALMSKHNKSVKIIESHEHFGGYGHNFSVGDYQFNAQLHYVASCGEGQVVHTFLKKLNLDETVIFNRLNAEGYDRVYCGDQKLFIPFGFEKLKKNMIEICPNAKDSIESFVAILNHFSQAANHFPNSLNQVYKIIPALPSFWKMATLRNATLQDVFNQCGLPKILQTLVSGQLIDYMLPPDQLSFLVWAALFNAYNEGAYYPAKHFTHVIDSLVHTIQDHEGTLHPNERVVEFIREGKSIKGVLTQKVNPKTGVAEGSKTAHYAKSIICNFDPKQAAEMIGIDHFSKQVSKALEYDYSYGSFVLYGIVEGLDLSQYGFGDWNIWHCQPDHNEAFKKMYNDNDYSKPYFAMNCRSLHTQDKSACLRENCQIFQICTVANYEYWKTLKLRSAKDYNLKKVEVLNHLLEAVEKHYVPNLRKHLVLKMTGSPTTNERYVNTPAGGSYGVNLTPRNFQFTRKLTSHSSLKNLYFCSAAAGAGGFAGTIWNGVSLYEKLSNDLFHSNPR